MKYLNKNVIDELNRQQQAIIDSDSSLIMVDACPGSGKTHTIVRRIQKELKENDNRGIIACSFTNEASNELEKRITKKGADISECYIGTIDSFILSEIIGKFLNRYLKLIWENYRRVEIKNFVFPDNSNTLVNDLTRSPNRKADIDLYYKNWLKKLVNGAYEISFPSYILASKIIDTDYFSDLYTQKYSTIYIDEAQDLNYYQHCFIDKIREKTNINVVMVGDPKQSIYQFRGANPTLFSQLEDKGYSRYNINVSVRCHPSISHYANKLVNNRDDLIIFDESTVSFINNLELDFLKSLEEGFFILCEANALAVRIYNKFKDDIEIYYVKAIEINSDDYKLNRDIIEEVLKYYYNHNNPLPKSVYVKEDFLNILRNANMRIKNSDVSIKNRSIQDYIKHILNLIGVIISDDTLSAIEEQLNNDIHKYYYFVTEKNNRIMTIHSSKGLENSNVIICLENRFQFNSEYKNKLFVAFTRAIDKLYLLPTRDFAHINILKKTIEME